MKETESFGKKIGSILRRHFIIKDQSGLEREIQSIIDAAEESGLIDPQSGEMIQSIFTFRETLVSEVMIPRTEIVAIPSSATIEEIIDLIARHGHTRMPVYSGNVDNIIGILNVKDLLKFWSKPVSEDDVVSNLRKPYYIPETKNILLLLHELKQKKSHMAIVIDEYGGTAGLVTLEDLIEEIVGEIDDEHDQPEGGIVELSDGYALIDGRMEIEKIEEYFEVKLPEGNYETLGGFILFAIRKIPVPGEVIQVDPLEMVIESADERTIKKVRVKKIFDDQP
ncbi:MAG: HlyC/CorC family transporter [Deltaproteobacteria bacterium]|nr:HlyC/CorC family transporter [Deltaproteobacteria bacterium]